MTYGKRTDDEMFHGYFDGVLLPPARRSLAPAALTCTVLAGIWLTLRRLRLARKS